MTSKHRNSSDLDTIISMSAVETARAIREQKVTSEEIVRRIFENIDENEYMLHAYVSFWKEEALEKARACDAKIREYYEKKGGSSGENAETRDGTTPENTGLPPLLGVPAAVKDNLLYRGKKATCGSKMLENYIPPYSATCVEKLEEAGAIIIGKTNMDEFGMGVSTENSYFGATSHPLFPEHVPGGSSGGSAAAVAAGEALVALGTDTGGSIRQPAAFCGLVGLRPTYGSVSRHGLVAFASSMDTAGPITRGSLDAAVLFNIVKGRDPKDQTSISSPDIDISAMESYSVRGKRIAIPKQLMGRAGDPDSNGEKGLHFSEEIIDAVHSAGAILEENGASVEEIDLPVLEYAVPVYYILSSAEASSNLSRYDGIRYGYRDPEAKDLSELYTKTRSSGFGLEVKRRILLGNYVLSSEHFEDIYRKAEKARDLIRAALEDAFLKYDLLLSPASPMTAPKKGEIADPLSAYCSDLCTVPSSLAGIPSVSFPFGESSEGLPIGLQLMGPKLGEQEILSAVRFFEKQGNTEERTDTKRAVSPVDPDASSKREEAGS